MLIPVGQFFKNSASDWKRLSVQLFPLLAEHRVPLSPRVMTVTERKSTKTTEVEAVLCSNKFLKSMSSQILPFGIASGWDIFDKKDLPTSYTTLFSTAFTEQKAGVRFYLFREIQCPETMSLSSATSDEIAGWLSEQLRHSTFYQPSELWEDLSGFSDWMIQQQSLFELAIKPEVLVVEGESRSNPNLLISLKLLRDNSPRSALWNGE
ncbi:hypothetical protein Tco_0303591, partial [Tanacetum coccineum]